MAVSRTRINCETQFLLSDGLIRSLDEPDREIDEIWSVEAEKRLEAHRN